MNRLKTVLLCICLILASITAAGAVSDDSNQNGTVTDDVTPAETPDEVSPDTPVSSEPEQQEETPAPIEDTEPEAIDEQEAPAVPEPETPDVVEPVIDEAEEETGCTIEDNQEEETPAPVDPGCSDDTEEGEETPCPVEDEPDTGCPDNTEDNEPCPEIDEPATDAGCSVDDTPAESDSKCSDTPVKECEKKAEPKEGCNVKPSESGCPTPEPKENKCPVIVKPIEPDAGNGCPLDNEPEPEDPVIPAEPEEPITPVDPVTPEDPVTPNDPVTPVTPNDPVTPVTPNKITTLKLCKNNVCTVGAAGNILSITNYANAKDPTYAELMDFLKEDKTDELPYTNSFQCGDFAVLLHNNAEKAGIKAGWEGANGCRHAYNLFNTTDKGLVKIDCTGVPGGQTLQDKQLNAKIGQPLTGKYLFRSGGSVNMGCTVTSLVTYW